MTSVRPCVEAVGYAHNRGYVLVQHEGRTELAHRVAYETAYGELPAGYEVHHACGNKRCEEPQHLEALTAEEHMRREGFLRYDARAHLAVLILRAQGLSIYRISALTGMSKSHVHRIVQGWKRSQSPVRNQRMKEVVPMQGTGSRVA